MLVGNKKNHEKLDVKNERMTIWRFLNGLADIKLKDGENGFGGIGGLASSSETWGVTGSLLAEVSSVANGGTVSRLGGETSEADSIRQGRRGLFGRGRVLLWRFRDIIPQIFIFYVVSVGNKGEKNTRIMKRKRSGGFHRIFYSSFWKVRVDKC